MRRPPSCSKPGAVQARIAYEVPGGLTLTNIAAYRNYRDRGKLDSDLDPIDFANQNEGRKHYRQFSDELRLSSPAGGRFSYQLGAYYLQLKTDELNNYGVDVQPLFPPPPAGFRWTIGASTAAFSRNTSAALFAEDQLEITPELNLTTGVRFTHDDVSFRYSTTQPDSVLSLYKPGLSRTWRRVRATITSLSA